jgi:hypothetical protein
MGADGLSRRDRHRTSWTAVASSSPPALEPPLHVDQKLAHARSRGSPGPGSGPRSGRRQGSARTAASSEHSAMSGGRRGRHLPSQREESEWRPARARQGSTPDRPPHAAEPRCPPGRRTDWTATAPHELGCTREGRGHLPPPGTTPTGPEGCPSSACAPAGTRCRQPAASTSSGTGQSHPRRSPQALPQQLA